MFIKLSKYLVSFLVLLLIIISACDKDETSKSQDKDLLSLKDAEGRNLKLTDEELLELISRKAFDFFWENQDPKTGLFADASGGGDASIASTGFGLTALCIGAERGWVDKNEAKNRALKCINTFIKNPNDPNDIIAEGKYGFFYHFLYPENATRAGRCEVSTIDTALLLCGILTAGEYFGEEIKEASENVYKTVEWDKFLNTDPTSEHFNQFSMGYTPERGIFNTYWSYYTDEILLINLLAIGSPSHSVSPDTFYSWVRAKDKYANGKPFIHSWHGALFTHQYAHAWFDFRNKIDGLGVDWWQNSTNATLANRQFCIDNAGIYRTYGPNSWGITSFYRPEKYTMHFGSPPTGSGSVLHDGTIGISGMVGSICFTPFFSISALKYIYFNYPLAWGAYGFKSSFNLDQNWYAPIYYGLDLGNSLLPIENFRSGLVWKTFMKNENIQKALAKAGFKSKLE